MKEGSDECGTDLLPAVLIRPGSKEQFVQRRTEEAHRLPTRPDGMDKRVSKLTEIVEQSMESASV